MDYTINILKRCPLFAGTTEAETQMMLSCLKPREQEYRKNALLFQAGDTIREIFILLSGNVRIIREDYDGNTVILANLQPGDLFGEAFACGGSPLAVTAEAGADCRVLQADCQRLLKTCTSACACHARLVSNLVSSFAQKNIFLTERIEHLSKRTLREKILSYLAEQVRLRGTRSFTIPFDRQGLADYLATDRSALSAVLSKLRDEGVLDFHKNSFTLR